MERGPMALFGAIVAVGLGPALWLGAQFGATAVPPPGRPTVAVVEANQSTKAPGAGAAAVDPTTEPTRPDKFRNRPGDRTERPSTKAPVEPEPSDEPEDGPSSSPTPTDDPTTPPTETTTEPEPDPEPTGDPGDDDESEPSPDDPGSVSLLS